MALVSGWGKHAPVIFPDPPQGPSCASGASFSSRTLCHPSFWPLYEAASGRDHRRLTSATVHQNGEQTPRDACNFPWSPQTQDQGLMSSLGNQCRSPWDGKRSLSLTAFLPRIPGDVP